MTVTRVRHVAVAVRDVKAAATFYRDLLHLPVLDASDGDLLLGCGASAVLLMAPRTPDLEAWIETNGEGIHHLAFETDDPGATGDLLPREDHLGLGIALYPPGAPPPSTTPDVRNIDHVVVSSNDSGACAAHFEAKLNLEIKRKMIRPGTNAQLAFGKLVDVILEFAGPPEPRPGELRAKYWGAVYNVSNIEGVLERCRAAGLDAADPKPAVQPGARIATVRNGTGGVPTAFIEYGP